MPFEIVRNSIVNMKVDAIVNTANPKPIVGGGVDSEMQGRSFSLQERRSAIYPLEKPLLRLHII